MAKKKSDMRRYIVMASEGFQNPLLTANEFRPSTHVVALAARAVVPEESTQMRVLDTIHENGPKLVEMSPEGELSLRLSTPGVKIVPEVFYHRQWQRFRPHRQPPKKTVAKRVKRGRKAVKFAATAAVAPAAVEITVTDRATGAPVKNAMVVAFTDFSARIGTQGKTGTNGSVRLTGISRGQALERVYVYAPPGYWGYYAENTTGARQSSIALRPIDITEPTLLLTQLYGNLPAGTGSGVTIAIVDSGIVGHHPDLTNVSGGLNCVSDEVRGDPGAAANWRPALKEGEHGTHVAGIAAGRGTAGRFHGVAPGATLRSYRVFPDGGGGASNFDIAKAIDAAIADGCDIINMSLGGGPKDDLTMTAIDRALEAGVLVVVAAGNDYRKPVDFPAAFPACVAVSAMGRIGSFPRDSIGASEIATPKGGPGNKDFIADFSNFGSEIDTTGAGVDIVSTLPGISYGAMSGTSMAAPAVTGFAAHLLSTSAAVRQLQGAARSRALKDLLYSTCIPEGFGRDFEGFGLPLPGAPGV